MSAAIPIVPLLSPSLSTHHPSLPTHLPSSPPTCLSLEETADIRLPPLVEGQCFYNTYRVVLLVDSREKGLPSPHLRVIFSPLFHSHLPSFLLSSLPLCMLIWPTGQSSSQHFSLLSLSIGPLQRAA
ncbi:unnamed protein product [Closterium sp. NIES-65]|nr:unnamed protein product [Closterium sp. NIES-65]